MIPGSRPLEAGNVCRTEAQVVAIVNGDSGKTVQISGRVLCEMIGEPDYTVELITDADVSALLSKDWFKWG